MPLVVVTANRARGDLSQDVSLRELGRKLQSFVATVLSCDEHGGKLTPSDVEVDLEDRDPNRHLGGEEYDLQIIVFANDFPSRRENLDERCRQLRDMIKEKLWLGGVKGFVWIRLAPAAFEEF